MGRDGGFKDGEGACGKFVFLLEVDKRVSMAWFGSVEMCVFVGRGRKRRRWGKKMMEGGMKCTSSSAISYSVNY